MHDKIFDENSLREAIVGVWGEYGAHVEVYDMLFKKLNELQTPLPDAAVREAVVNCEVSLATGGYYTRTEGVYHHVPADHLRTLLRAVQSPRLTGEQMEAIQVAASLPKGKNGDRAWARRKLEAAFPEAFAGEV